MNTQIIKRIKIIAMLSAIIIIPFIALAQEDKVVDITVSGSGATLDDAKQNALRSAIEQAFGTFVSSNTEILNDELVKDEIVSIANGNIQKYDVISEVNLPNGDWATTLKVKVSVNKLIKFSEGKGVTVEFKGNMFAVNVKQQILNEEAEIKTVKNMCKVLKELSDSSFDFSLEVGEPTSADSENKDWVIPMSVNVNVNDNFIEMQDYLISTLSGISLNNSEVMDYRNKGKDVYSVGIVPMKSSKVQELNPSDREKVTNMTNYLASLDRKLKENKIKKKEYNEEYNKVKKMIENIKTTNLLESNNGSVFYFRRDSSFILLGDFIFSLRDEFLNAEISNGVGTYNVKNRKLHLKLTKSNASSLILAFKSDSYDTQVSYFKLRNYYNIDGIKHSSKLRYFRGNSFLVYDTDVKNSGVNLKVNERKLKGKYSKVSKLINKSLTNDVDYGKCLDLVIYFSDIDLSKPILAFSLHQRLTLNELSGVTEYSIEKAKGTDK